MMKILLTLLFSNLLGDIYGDNHIESDESFKAYLVRRNAFLKAEESLSINSVWNLTPEEEKVDDLLKSLKAIDQALDPVPTQFSFSSVQSTIDESKLFDFVRHFPKGALLHSHDTSSQDMHFYIKQSYRDDCLYNVGDDEEMYGALSFQPGANYVPISEIRNSWPSGVEDFDKELYLNFTLLPYLDQPDITGDFLWSKFQPIFSRVGSAYQYLPVFQEFFRNMFPKLWEDGISQWQMRTSLIEVYDNNKTYTKSETLQFILDELEAWRAVDPVGRSVFSFSVIIQGIRSASVEEVTAALTSAYVLREEFPDIVVGFDLVGHEDPGKTLLYWAPILMATEEALHRKPRFASSPYMPFMFHAGESNRYPVQENLVDAVLLNSSRIGHGFGIQEFPALWPLLVEKSIIIESCPISNQLLGLIVDQRNHPVGQMLHHAAHTFTNTNPTLYSELAEIEPMLDDLLFEQMAFTPTLAVSISNDDPGFWGIDAISSYDWYIAILAWDLSLGGIKMLAMDSLLYSGVSKEKRAELVLNWATSWNAWIKELQ